MYASYKQYLKRLDTHFIAANALGQLGGLPD